MKLEEKFPYQVELLFPLNGPNERYQSRSHLREVNTWLNEHIGCENIRWMYDSNPLSIEEQRELQKRARIVFRFKLEDASVHFKMVWA